MKYLVTGGAGFIGSNLVDKLISLGNDVVILDDLSSGKEENINPDAEFYKEDITDLEAIAPYFNKIDVVFHLAARARVQISINDPIGTHDSNVTGTLNVLRASSLNNVKKVISSSSSSVYGENYLPLNELMKPNPKSPYAAHKYIGEIYCKLFNDVYGLQTVSLRYFNVYGPRQVEEGAYALVIAKFLKLRREGKVLTITGDGTQTRDFTWVDDVVNANILAATKDTPNGAVYNIGNGNNVSVNTIAQMISHKQKYIDARFEPHDTLADSSLAKYQLGWSPKVNIGQGIERLLQDEKD